MIIINYNNMIINDKEAEYKIHLIDIILKYKI